MWRSIAMVGAVAMAFGVAPALAGQFEFLAAPQIDLSLVYRLDKLTGDVVACQFAKILAATTSDPGALESRPVIAAAKAQSINRRGTMAWLRRATSRRAGFFASIIGRGA